MGSSSVQAKGKVRAFAFLTSAVFHTTKQGSICTLPPCKITFAVFLDSFYRLESNLVSDLCSAPKSQISGVS